ncbi:hypothetical protein BWO91_19155 [Plantibacter flavus]|uniref:hypothetical protein n=1 Tax=Plantibacter flavus TaxID=150123 RepID=UPI00099DD265|nr:hypothetical protein [Plantibacter flavus]AQX81789.1 hypothetical protein BWO91_19155 [Plantibacter flavus]
MPQLYGADEVARLQNKLAAVFSLVDGAGLEAEVLAHYSRYLAVQLAGFSEESLKLLVSAHARKRSTVQIHRFVEGRIRLLWGINATKLKDTLDSFDTSWWHELQQTHSQEVEALNSVGKLRDSITHGGNSGVSMPIVKQYRDDVFRLFRKLSLLLDPPS